MPFYIRDLTSVDFGIHRGTGTNPLRIMKDNLSLWGVKSYTGIFNWGGGQLGREKAHLTPGVVPGSTVICITM